MFKNRNIFPLNYLYYYLCNQKNVQLINKESVMLKREENTKY